MIMEGFKDLAFIILLEHLLKQPHVGVNGVAKQALELSVSLAKSGNILESYNVLQGMYAELRSKRARDVPDRKEIAHCVSNAVKYVAYAYDDKVSTLPEELVI